jgi:putative ABC transport system permease protein
MIGYGLWQRRFGADPALVGKTIHVNGEMLEVAGILPRDFDFPRGAEWPSFFSFSGQTEIWLPLAFNVQTWQSRDERGLVAIGRLRTGRNLRQAQAEMDAFAASQARAHAETHKGWSLQVTPLHRQLAGKSQSALLLLLASVGVLLVIACVNVASLLLARGAARRKELAVRVALGAEGSRLIRQLLTESLLLSVLGGALGLLVAQACLRLFLRLNPASSSRLDDASINLSVLGFTALASLAATAAFGLVPALQELRLDLCESLQDGARRTGGSVRQSVRGWLVGSQVALAVILSLAASRLLTAQLYEISPSDPATFASILSFVGLVALLACWLPARRAARVDPMVTLRTD